MLRKIWGFLFLIFILSGLAIAKDQYRPIPGAIPLQYGGYPATDLVLNGKVLLPEEAHKYYMEKGQYTRGGFTLADLQPEENDVWKNQLGKKYDATQDELPIADQLDEVSFVSYALTRLENYRFTVTKDHSFYVGYMGPKIHNFLLRKNLLRKLGYNVPAVKYIKNVKVNFNTVQERDDFLQDFQTNVGRDIERWVTAMPKGENFFYAQDLIMMEDQNTLSNLSVGIMDEDTIEGRRIYNSLLVPYSLTDLPESINLLSWTQGRIYSENVLMPYEDQQVFSCSRDDGVWIARRLLALSENDWYEVVENSHLPDPVAALLFEKLKSRRNNLATLFKLDAKKFEVNSHYTDQDGVVVDGKLQKEFFNGYGRRFKIPDPESPLSFGEMSSLVKAKALNVGMELLVGAFNSMNFMSNDVDTKINTINQDIAVKASEKLKAGKSLSGLVDKYVLPTVSGKIILSRDIVAGSYLGTDNLIQLVDTIGVSVNGGAFGGIAGIFAKTGDLSGLTYAPISLTGSATLSLTRSYSHIKPITSVKKALKYPFKNVIIPLLKRKQGHTLKEESGKDYDKINALAKKERDHEYQTIFDTLTNSIEVGESVIITDTVSVEAAAQAGIDLYTVANLRARIEGNSLVISRLHLLRKSENIFQVYRDLGQNNSLQETLALDKIIPILKASDKMSKGEARTKFYNINLNKEDPGFKKKLAALAAVFGHNSLSLLDKEQKPYQINHNFTEQNPGFGVLVFRWNSLDSTDNITVKAPNGDEKKFIRRYRGFSTGIDFESYAQDMVGLLTSKIFKTQFSPSSFNSSNPGFTYYGRAYNKIQVFEGELAADKKTMKPYTRLTRIWNGWQMKVEGAVKKLEQIKKRYQFNFMPAEVLAQTKKLFLYNINVNLYVHKEGIAALVLKKDEEIKDAFMKFQARDMTNYTGDDALKFSGYKEVINWKKEYQKEIAKSDLKKASHYLLKMISKIESKLTVGGFEALLGGKAGFLLQARIDGFRIGDEKGDQPLISNTFGTLGSDTLGGPTADVLGFFQQTGGATMIDGEFYVNWLLGRLI